MRPDGDGFGEVRKSDHRVNVIAEDGLRRAVSPASMHSTPSRRANLSPSVLSTAGKEKIVRVAEGNNAKTKPEDSSVRNSTPIHNNYVQ